MTVDLAVWLRAQLDADEEVARAAVWDGYTWIPEPCHVARADVDVCVTTHPADAEFIARFDQAFVLADIAAKRTILDLHTNRGGWGHECVTIRRDAFGRVRLNEEYYEADSPCQTLRLLARPYAGRPGWSDEWKVT